MAEAPSHPEFEEQEEPLVEEGRGLAAQWSLEDEEEAARERRRRERDRNLGVQDQDGGSPSPPPPEQERLLKASEAPEVDEDEGFSDWAQKPELQPPQEESPELEKRENGQPPKMAPRLRGWEGEREEENETARRRRGAEGVAGCIFTGTCPGLSPSRLAPRPLTDLASLPCKVHSPHREQGSLGSERPASLGHTGPRGNQDVEELIPTGVGLEQLQLCSNSEPRGGLDPEWTEPGGPGETSPGRLSPAEPQEAEGQYPTWQQRRTPSPLVLEDNTEPGSPPLSPSTKLIDRTESLNRSIKKSNSVKRSQPALPISKIDGRLEQYTQAIETAGRIHKLTRQPSIELPSMAVASTKSLWETGEVQAQSAAKAPPCKDIVAGDMSMKDLWEQKGGSKMSSTIKSTASGKRYKFVATGHGKYEKVLLDEGSAP
ncbi:lymphocyte-specific protein 1 [Rhynchonycteris naso]